MHNPAQSLPDLTGVAEAFANAERVIVQEAFRTTETARLADAAACIDLGRKHGTVTNSGAAHHPCQRRVAAAGRSAA